MAAHCVPTPTNELIFCDRQKKPLYIYRNPLTLRQSETIVSCIEGEQRDRNAVHLVVEGGLQRSKIKDQRLKDQRSNLMIVLLVVLEAEEWHDKRLVEISANIALCP